MTYTVTADGVRRRFDDLSGARAAAVEAARGAGRAEVHRIGLGEIDDGGRDVTPSFLVGTALATRVGGVTVVR